MTTARVALFGRTNASVVIRDTEATAGAVFGVNLVWPDGSLVTQEDFSGSAETAPSDSIVYWRLIQEVPPNVQQVAGLSVSGFVRRGSDGSWTAAPITNPDLANANTSGLAEGSNLYYTNARADARVAIGIAAHVAEADPHPQYALKSEVGIIPLIDFSYGDASPVVVHTVADAAEVIAVSLQIEQAFNGAGAAISLGTAASPGLLFSSAMNNPAVVGVFEFSPREEIPVGTDIILTITPGAGASQGAGQIFIQATPAS